MHLIDSHTHLYSKEFDSDRKESIERAIQFGIKDFLLPNVDLESIVPMHELVDLFPNNCKPMMGLHPCSVDESVDEVLGEIIKQFRSRKNEYIAIGEIGIDLYWDRSFLKQQQDAFSRQIDLAKEENLPIVIHCRESFDEIFEILDEKNSDRLRGIFHCFTGTEEQGRRILNYGDFKLGIGGVVTFKNSGLDKVVSKFKLEDLVLETDSPYLAPVPYRGKRNESGYLMEVAKKLADIFEKEIKEVARITTMNCKDIFRL